MPGLPFPQLLADLKDALGKRERKRVNKIVGELLFRDAPMGRHWRHLAEVMLRNGELTLARSAVARYVAVEGNSPAARFFEAVVLARSGSVQAARDIAAGLPKVASTRTEQAYLSGTIEAALGNWSDAREYLIAAVEARPDSGQAWLALAMTGTECGDKAIAKRLLDAGPALTGASALDRAQYHFACGKVLADWEEHSRAFAAFEAGCAIMRKERPHDVDRDVRLAGHATQGFDRKLFDNIAEKVAVDTGKPIFVTGSPRSGSTLVEQILTSHSAVIGGEELGKFGIVGEEIGGLSGTALVGWLARGNDVNSLTGLYRHLVDERFGTGGRIVDKTLDASRYLGIVAAILPDAPLIWMRRNRLDSAFSCFKTFFVRSVDWSYDQRQIARHFALEDALLAEWANILGKRLLIIDYEALVQKPNETILEILAHCGLDPEPSVFKPHLTQRAVSTASVSQVREPINLRGIGAANPYRTYLRPFTHAYGDLGGTAG